jgi:hypothetical protein
LFLDTQALPCLQTPIADEIEGTTTKNLEQKRLSKLVLLQALLEKSPFQFYAEIAATRGWIDWDQALPVAPSGDTLDAILAENGFGEAWQDLCSASSVMLLNDDSQTSMTLHQGDRSQLLTFQYLETLLAQHPDDSSLQKLQASIRDVAAYMQAAHISRHLARTGELLQSQDPWDWYMQQHRGECLLGPDGSSIADLLGPQETLRALHALAGYAGGVISDIRVTSTSKVSAAVLNPAAPQSGAALDEAEASSAYRFLSWEKISQLFEDGGESHLSDVLLPGDDGERTVRDYQHVRSETPLLARAYHPMKF